ncbi:hypothetical protein SPD48_09450 [Pseudogracilibacillus sp. SE30717A]|uniref:hypothetical protein n=1 Tax=Pseudogracilibacillus sp. SE30717A TaxID=3098293 RepID=UPI00300E6AF7
MKLEIRNIDIPKCLNFLKELNITGVNSINRTKITRYLNEQLQELAENEREIRETAKNDMKKMNEWLKEYYNQTLTVEGANFKEGLIVIKNQIEEMVAEDSEQKFSGDDADALAILYENLVMDKEEK